MAESIDGYIKREDALLICDKAYKKCLRMADYCGDTVAWNIGGDIKLLPAADVEPVRHGRFVGGYKMISGKWVYEKPRCSECGKESSGATRYCPNCGAKMDGEETAADEQKP